MAFPLYSASLAQFRGLGAALASPQTLTVPDGVIWVVRDVDWWCAAPFPLQSVQRWTGAAGQTIDWFVVDADTTVVHPWRGRQVFESGQSMEFSSTQGADVSVSGYVLLAP